MTEKWNLMLSTHLYNVTKQIFVCSHLHSYNVLVQSYKETSWRSSDTSRGAGGTLGGGRENSFCLRKTQHWPRICAGMKPVSYWISTLAKNICRYETGFILHLNIGQEYLQVWQWYHIESQYWPRICAGMKPVSYWISTLAKNMCNHFSADDERSQNIPGNIWKPTCTTMPTKIPELLPAWLRMANPYNGMVDISSTCCRYLHHSQEIFGKICFIKIGGRLIVGSMIYKKNRGFRMCQLQLNMTCLHVPRDVHLSLN